jgi:hypothetical protein
MPYIYVNISMSEFDDDDLVDELTSRGFVVSKGTSETSIPIGALAIYEAMKRGDKNADELAREWTIAQCGRVSV